VLRASGHGDDPATSCADPTAEAMAAREPESILEFVEL
jgi:hypothetical protein